MVDLSLTAVVVNVHERLTTRLVSEIALVTTTVSLLYDTFSDTTLVSCRNDLETVKVKLFLMVTDTSTGI